ncbi:MAG: hypothetical protein QFX12_03290 [Rickettsia africae]
MGLDAFDSSIEYHDQDLTDVYVVFTYNKAWEQKSSIDIPSVEMIITMATSRTQILFKAPIYDYNNTKKHSSLSLKLHNFIAKCAEIIYPNKKEYMITVPTKNITHIIIKEYEKKQILGEKKAPIKFTEAGYGAFSDLVLYGKNGEVLNKLTADQIKGEFAWFCTSPYLLKNQHEQEPLITCDLDTLTNLSFKNSYIDIIQK